jgi:hypothetical protein
MFRSSYAFTGAQVDTEINGLIMAKRKPSTAVFAEAKIEAAAEAEAQRVSKATQRAEAVLAGLLEWVGKSDGRTAFLFAVNTAMGGIALSNLGSSRWSIFEVIVYLFYFVLFGSISFHLIMVQFPNINSPNRSSIFFGTIAGQSFDDFIQKFSSMKDEEYLRDVLHQCHVNSVIVQKKFQRLAVAMRLLIISSMVWVVAIAAPSFATPEALTFLHGIFVGADASPIVPSRQ